MSWTIILESENKETISMVGSEFEIEQYEILKQYKLLQYLDPYGNTTFNQLQIEDLIKDLNNLKIIENNLVIDNIVDLAKKCLEEQHSYLTFYGD